MKLNRTLLATLGFAMVVSPMSQMFPTTTTVAKTVEATQLATDVAQSEYVGLPNLDVRRDPITKVINGANILSAARKAPVDHTQAIEAFVSKVPAGNPESVKIDLHDSGLPKQVANFEGLLTLPMAGTPDDIARAFLIENSDLFGLSEREVRNLKLTVNDLDKAGDITYLKYTQMIKGVPVFDSEIGITVTPRGEVAIANFGQTLPGGRVSTKAALTETEAITKAFEYCGVDINGAEIVESASRPVEASEFKYYVSPLGEGHEDIMFQKTVVNVHGNARLAYRAYVDKNGNEWYDTLVDANTGELLIRFNIVSDAQGQVFTSNPGQTASGSRTLQQFAPLFGVTDPWVGSGTVSTGNNVDAYLDRDANNSPDTTTTASTGTNPGLTSGRADSSKGSPAGEFTFSYSSSTAPTSQQANAVTNLWYFNNYMHDWMYSLGFTESARNFQTNNFGRGGTGNDAVKAEAQDGSGTNNANFATPADGSAGRMQQYIFTTTTPNRDSDLDGDVVLHEYGHGVSNRLIGNGSGLGGTQSGAMGEGWSDYWACSNYNDGVMGEYVVANSAGIRRAPYTVPAAAVHDSYADVGSGGFEVHNDGEVWCAALWDLNRTLGKAKADQLVLTGMKNTPSSPSMVSARTGIVTACNTLYPADVCTVWTVFARHGLGNSASGNDGTSHVAATDLPTSCGGTPPPPCSSSTTAITTSGSGSLATTDCASTVRTSGTFYYDNFTFSATAGTQVTITLNSSAFDTYLYLLNGATVLASDDDGNGGTNSKIVYTPTASGTLTIHCTSYSAGATGAYTVTLAGGSTPTVPNAPSGLAASAASTSQINISWTDNSSNETGFKIERKTGSGGTYAEIATVGANVTNYSNTGLAASTTYYYRVRATNATGDSAYSNEANATTSSTPPPPTCSSGNSAITVGAAASSGSLATTDCSSMVRTSGTFYYDNFTFSATAGTAYTITLNSSAFDTYLYLLSGTTVLASDDDGNGGTNSKIVITPSSSGTLTIHCTSYAASATGAYTVQVTGGSTPPPTTELVTNGGFETGSMSPWVAASYSTVTTGSPQAGTYKAQMLGRGTTTSTNFYQALSGFNGTSKTLRFYLKISSAEGTSRAYDYLYVRLKNTSGSTVSTLATYSNRNKTTYANWTLITLTVPSSALSNYRISFDGTEDSSLQTTYYIDGVSVQ